MRLDDKQGPAQKLPSSATRSFSNGDSGSVASTPVKPASSVATNGSSVKSERNGYANGGVDTRPHGPFFGHDREEVTRILIQSLTELGYHGAAGTLSQESGYELENTSVAAFRLAIQEGEWMQAENLLFGSRAGGDVATPHNGSVENVSGWVKNDGAVTLPPDTGSNPPGLPLAEGANKHEMLFFIRQQKYLELLERRDLGTALMVLRHELTPLHRDTSRLHALSSLMMCQSARDLRMQADWDGASGESRSVLLSDLSKSIAPSVMIPEHRLAVLLDQVQEGQINQCLYHNTTVPPSLYYDHLCERNDFPLDILTDLYDHTDEVWYIDFSRDGSMLASASSDNSILIYDTARWKPLMRLADHHGIGDVTGVCYVAWSPDDRYLLSCSRGNDLIVYDIKTGGSKVASIDHFEYTVTSAAWAADGKTFVVGSHDSKRPLGLYTLHSSDPIYSWPHEDHGLRVNDCSISRDGSRLAVITNDKRILVYDFRSRAKIAEWVMDDLLTCLNLSHDGNTVLVSMNNSQLMLLDAETGDLIQKYTGLKQRQFVIRSAFGGAGENFVVSGSEDSHVYVWRRQSGVQVAALPAHGPGTVNCVAWHPMNPAVFASAGDDRRVRIWSNGQPQRVTEKGLRR